MSTAGDEGDDLAAAEPPVVGVRQGRLRGDRHGGALVFRGIPYAAPPTGERRFRPPAPPEPWTGVRDATSFGPAAPQLPSLLDQYFGTKDVPRSEDCLTLNVWTPACDHERRPVLVWVHGGAFTTGTAATPWYSGTAFARSGCVLVSLNYRLGALGFTHLGDLPGIPDELADSGNLGLLDVIAGLGWVRDSIAQLGGDPGNVTVFGESAGGSMVLALLASPAARGLFHRAVAQSASFSQLRSRERATEAAAELLAALDLEPGRAERIVDVPVDHLLRAQGTLLARQPGAFTAFAPTPGSDVLPDPVVEALASGAAGDVPLLIGTTRDELLLFTFLDPAYAQLDDAGLAERAAPIFGPAAPQALRAYRAARPGWTPGQVAAAVGGDHGFRMPAIRLAEARARVGASTWMYLFAWESPVFDGSLKSCHGLEIPFVFHTVHQPGVALFTGDGPEREALADEVHGRWVRFATEGDPGWAPYREPARETRRFGWGASVESADVGDPEDGIRLAWQAAADADATAAGAR